MHVGVFTLRDLNIAGGSLIRIVGLTQYLVETGCRVTLFAPNVPPQLENHVQFVPLQGRAARFGMSSAYAAFPTAFAALKLLPYDTALASMLRRAGVDIVHAHQHPAGFRMAKIRERLGVPVVFDVHGIFRLQLDDHQQPGAGPVRTRLLLRTERTLFSKVDGLTVRTEAERRYLVRAYALSTDKVHVVPDGADVEFLACPASATELDTLRSEYGLEGKRLIFFGGEFKSQSGILDLVHAFRVLTQTQPDIVLALLGDGLLMPQVREMVDTLPVILLGRQSRNCFRLWQQLADVVVTPEIRSAYNNLATPLKLLDCLASGRPLVATDIDSHREVVRDGINGFLVAPNDAADMARGLDRALAAGCNGEIAHRALEDARQHHSWRVSAQAAVAAYQRVLGDTG